AGMSGGIAYVYDETGRFDNNCNLEMVDLELMSAREDIEELLALIKNHLKYTGSRKAAYILDNWELCLPQFIKVIPMEYKRVLGLLKKDDEATEREEVVNE
ncbi:MAG: hypothetical protein KJ626_09995, partial [Verrucomicrobia bacterium]|nr:hypothetical protein [Verrucomicrobiota bacterium]